MKYKNLETGFIFESKSEISAEGWVKLDPQPTKKVEESEEKPKRKRTVKK